MKKTNKANTPWVIVTGAASGIGLAVAKRCAADGFQVLAIDRDEDGLHLLRESENDAVAPLTVELADKNAGQSTLHGLQRLHKSVFNHKGSPAVRGIVNVAGVSQGDSIDGITDEDWQYSMDVNATAPMRLTRALLPLIDGDQGASIVNIASPVALVGCRKVSYAASKGALLGLNAALTQNLSPEGIRVNAILPGPTITGMTDDWPEEKRTAIAADCPLGRLCTPEDIAGPVSFLLSDDAAYITGAVLNVTGGSAMGV